MFIEVEKAHETWCPMVRNSSSGGAHNSGTSDRKSDFAITKNNGCIANRCAMWRWTQNSRAQLNSGYCGLAGIPVCAEPNK